MGHLLSWMKHRKYSLAVAFIIVLVAMFGFEGLRNALNLRVNVPIEKAIPLNICGYCGASGAALRAVVGWILTAWEVISMTFVLAYLFRLLRPVSTIDPATLTPVERRKRRHRNHVLAWVFFGSTASVVFAVSTVSVILMAYYSHWIPALTTMFIAYKIWPFVCIGEVCLQIIPMNVRLQTQGWDVVADEFTSYFPMVGCVVVLTAMYFAGFAIGDEGWLIWGESLGVALIELLLIAVGNKLIAAARGNEDAPAP